MTKINIYLLISFAVLIKFCQINHLLKNYRLKYISVYLNIILLFLNLL